MGSWGRGAGLRTESRRPGPTQLPCWCVEGGSQVVAIFYAGVSMPTLMARHASGCADRAQLVCRSPALVVQLDGPALQAQLASQAAVEGQAAGSGGSEQPLVQLFGKDGGRWAKASGASFRCPTSGVAARFAKVCHPAPCAALVWLLLQSSVHRPLRSGNSCAPTRVWEL